MAAIEKEMSSPFDDDLDFEDIEHSAALNNADNKNLLSEGYGASPEDQDNHSMFSVAYYRKYFDVDTQLIKTRFLRSLVPSKQTFFAESVDQDMEADVGAPDLYGPFWITTTLIVLIAAAGNLADYLASSGDTKWESDFQLVSTAASLLYGWVFIVPVIVWFLSKSLGNVRSLVELVSLYGYSLSVFIPSAILCIFPYSVLRWTLILVSFSLSSWFLLRNIYFTIPDQSRPQAISLFALIFAVNATLSLILKLYFFNYDLY